MEFYMPDSLIDAFDFIDGVSAIKLFCAKDIRNSVNNFFNEQLNKHWEDEKSLMEKENIELDDPDEPTCISTKITDYGILVDVPTLEIMEDDGICWDLSYGERALVNTLNDILHKFPDVQFIGFVNFIWSTTSSSDAFSDMYKSRNYTQKIELDEAFDFLGKKLDYIIATEPAIWDCIPVDDFKNKTLALSGNFKHFDTTNDFAKYINSNSKGTITDTITSDTYFLICNDENSNDTQITQAKKLGIPILTEDEFLVRLGKDEDFEIDVEYASQFWNTISYSIEDEYLDVIEFAKFFHKYIHKEHLLKFVFNIIELHNSIMDEDEYDDNDTKDALIKEFYNIKNNPINYTF